MSFSCESLLSTCFVFFFFSSRRRHTRLVSDWSSDVCSSDLIRHTRLVSDWSSDVCPSDHGIRDWSVTGVQTCALPISELQSLTNLVCRLLEFRDRKSTRLNSSHCP